MYAPQRYRPNYSNRRVWRVLSAFASPEVAATLPSHTNPYADDYPFSVPVNPSKRASVQDLMDIQRDHYEGTEFDMTKGLAAGPYGDPNRYDVSQVDNMTVSDVMQGEFSRAISLFRTSYSFVAHARSFVPDELSLVWIAQYAPDVSTFTPIYVTSEQLPLSWIRGNMNVRG